MQKSPDLLTLNAPGPRLSDRVHPIVDDSGSADEERGPRADETDAQLRILIEQALRGSGPARNELFATVAPKMAAVVRSALAPGGTAELDDAVQEALLRLNRALPRYRGECTVVYFATRVAVNTATDFIRRRTVRRKYEGAAASRPEEEGPLPGPTAVACAQRSRLQFLLEDLSEVQAETLVYVALGHSVQEIAAGMNVPVETVRSRLRLARRSVRARIEADPRLKELFGRGE